MLPSCTEKGGKARVSNRTMQAHTSLQVKGYFSGVRYEFPLSHRASLRVSLTRLERVGCQRRSLQKLHGRSADYSGRLSDRSHFTDLAALIGRSQHSIDDHRRSDGRYVHGVYAPLVLVREASHDLTVLNQAKI